MYTYTFAEFSLIILKLLSSTLRRLVTSFVKKFSSVNFELNSILIRDNKSSGFTLLNFSF